MIALLVTYIASGLLLSGLALPLVWRKIPPNRWYGFRVRRMLEDETVWYAVNEFSARRMLWVGVATVAAAIGFFFQTNSVDLYGTSVAAVVLGGLSVCLIQSFRYLRTFGTEK
ncbi:MAG: SdpI family protein [Thermoguttaceae bacterium]